jgi:hypothetical protein
MPASPSRLVLALAAVLAGCSEVSIVPSGADAEVPDPPTSCDVPAPPCSLEECSMCPAGDRLDTTAGCSCCTAGALPDGITAPYALRIHGTGLGHVSGRKIFAAAGYQHTREGRVIAETTVCGGQFDLRIAGAVPGEMPGIAVFFDLDDDGLCDSTIDSGGDASPWGTKDDVDLEVPPTAGLSSGGELASELACEHFGYSLTVAATGLTDGGVGLVRLYDAASGKLVSERRTATRTSPAGEPSFGTAFIAPLGHGSAYRVDVLLDRDGDDACDPATDVAWQRTLGPIFENETVELTGDEPPIPAACAAFGAGG